MSIRRKKIKPPGTESKSRANNEKAKAPLWPEL